MRASLLVFYFFFLVFYFPVGDKLENKLFYSVYYTLLNVF